MGATQGLFAWRRGGWGSAFYIDVLAAYPSRSAMTAFLETQSWRFNSVHNTFAATCALLSLVRVAPLHWAHLFNLRPYAKDFGFIECTPDDLESYGESVNNACRHAQCWQPSEVAGACEPNEVIDKVYIDTIQACST